MKKGRRFGHEQVHSSVRFCGYHGLTRNHPHNSICVEDMVQYSHVRGGLRPKRRVVFSKLLPNFPLAVFVSDSLTDIVGSYKRFVAEPVDSESICFTNLPYEIRQMIWHSCLESRIDTICARPRHT
ncbi:uncharacterized protein Bfra_001219 [Botrytis fragariae]|uniref:Uncharacterized protein n=1 Tax=Botrytis fragariae TaxID=1964551 RepID=A0A8H6B019_9HELO|nr:uncharacterized protein Bfra_001219 [Botrytis fragariae]KAF5876864.1 hypothetical protein Bfra_001219 [Botrytis fragariae]